MLALLLAGAALLVAGCGGGEEVGATPETVVGSVPRETTSSDDLPALALEGGCHSRQGGLRKPGVRRLSHPLGSRIDRQRRPEPGRREAELRARRDRVTKGQGAMPAFGDQLTAQQIADVAQYVVDSTSG